MLRLCIAALVLLAAGCDTLDMSKTSCGTAEGSCINQCRNNGGPAQMACEDQCREEANMCKAREY